MKRTITTLLTLFLFAATLVALPAAASATDTPSLVKAEYSASGSYTNVVWAPLPGGVKGVNVYRNGSYVSTVASPGTVYNDFGGSMRDTYYVVAFDYAEPPNFSGKSNALSTSLTLPPIRNLQSREVGDSRIALSWDPTGMERRGGWRVYRNGAYMLDRPFAFGPTALDYTAVADQITFYEVRPYTWDAQGKIVWGPRTPVAVPALQVDASARNHPQHTTVYGTNATSNRLAAEANAAAAVAAAEKEEATKAKGAFAGSLVDLAIDPGLDTAASAVGAGVNAVREEMQAEHAKEVAAEKKREYDSCMSSSCSAPPAPGGTDTGGDDRGGNTNTGGSTGHPTGYDDGEDTGGTF